MMNAMITKMIKNEKKYFKDFQCVAGSVLHNTMPITLDWLWEYHGNIMTFKLTVGIISSMLP